MPLRRLNLSDFRLRTNSQATSWLLCRGYPTPRSVKIQVGLAASSPSLRLRLRTKMRARLALMPSRPCFLENGRKAGTPLHQGRNLPFRVPPIAVPYRDPNKTVLATVRYRTHIHWRYRHGCRHGAVSFVPMREIGGGTPSPGRPAAAPLTARTLLSMEQGARKETAAGRRRDRPGYRFISSGGAGFPRRAFRRRLSRLTITG